MLMRPMIRDQCKTGPKPIICLVRTKRTGFLNNYSRARGRREDLEVAELLDGG